MAKPRVFVSSTYYDLKHLRSSLDSFIKSLGFEPVLSEMGDITYAPDMPLDESCYREAQSADVFVLIIGGRYGSASSATKEKPSSDFYERYDSITKQEYKNAIVKGVPTYVLIEAQVHGEYRTFLKNADNKKINYASVDSVNIFELIREILAQPMNNPVFPFERHTQIESWLREQWAGLFKELLDRATESQQMASLNAKVSELGEINETLKVYMETIVSKVSPDESVKLIDYESKRLADALIGSRLRSNGFVSYVLEATFLDFEVLRKHITFSTSHKNFVDRMRKGISPGDWRRVWFVLKTLPGQEDLNRAREIVGKARFPDSGPGESLRSK